MANQNIGTPRFYISLGDYWRATGSIVSGLYTISPYQTETLTIAATDTVKFFSSVVDIPNPDSCVGVNFCFVLNHDFNARPRLKQYVLYTDGATDQEDIYTESTSNDTVNYYPDTGGYSLCTFNPWVEDYSSGEIQRHYIASGIQNTVGTYSAGSFVFGRYFNMPHSPELSLTMSHEYDGIKKQETAGGSTLSYANYYKPPDWGDLQAWQLDGWDRKYSGRRVWNLTFNHLSDSDLEPYHYNIDSTSGHTNWNEDGNWFTNVIHYTNGGQLPFIFCPDPSIGYATSTWTVPEFAICRFDMKTFKREQVANGIYNIKVKIKESW